MGGSQPLKFRDLHPNQHSIQEGLKEVARYLVFGVLVEIFMVVIPVLLLGIDTATGNIAINWQLAKAVGLATLFTALLRGVDKFTHAKGKLLYPESAGRSQGILGF